MVYEVYTQSMGMIPSEIVGVQGSMHMPSPVLIFISILPLGMYYLWKRRLFRLVIK